MANKHDEAIAALNESPLAKDEKSKLLYKVELGLLEHYKGNYLQSTKYLSEAKALLDDLYTTRASGKISSALGNDNSDFYYGEKYEASLVYFYLALNQYMQANLETDPTKKKEALLSARSEILAWDSFLTEIKNERLGKALFKEDLLAKTFGALIHEAQQTVNDDQIALQLYKDASDVYFKNYNLFPTFNAHFKMFRENYENLPKISPKEVEGKYVLATKHSPALKEFLTMKILVLTKKIRPQDFKNQVSKLAPSNELLKRVNQAQGNVTFLVQDGMITEKYPKKYEIPINLIGRAGIAYAFGTGNRIEYELPHMMPSPDLEVSRLEALDAAGNIVATSSLSVIAPLGELAEQAINEHSTSIAAKTGARVVGKHIAALVATNVSYNVAKDRNPTLALLVATAGHATAIAAINQSEKADVRYWSTLPSNIRMGSMSLADGTYRFRAVFGEAGAIEYRTIELGEQTVSKGNLKFVMNNKNLKYKANMLAYSDAPTKVDVDTSGFPEPQKIATGRIEPISRNSCMKDSDCPQDTVCATVRGEYPGSCAATGLLGGIGRNPNAIDCNTDTECGPGRVCATVRGEYPGSCALK